jgi:hypothetical protein
MYDSNSDSLSAEDAAYLDALHDRFLAGRLLRVGSNSIAGHLIGKLLADAEEQGISWQSILVGQLPVEIDTARTRYSLTPADEAAIELSRDQSATYITDMSERLREEIRGEVTRAVGDKESPLALAHTLQQRFGEANHDWRRIALTEAAVAESNGYLTAQEPGQILVGDSSMEACEWCAAHIHGRAFTMLAEPPSEVSDALSWSSVWVGKTNIGRTKYPYKVGGVKRTTAELWHPCIPAHPHCRCRWRRLIPSVEEVKPGSNLVEQKTVLGLL